MSNRRYGYFECDECGSSWESAHVYCDGFEPVYEQDCRTCDTPCLPIRVEKLICSVCNERDCICTECGERERNIDPSKAHRSDLCHKCQLGYPCQ
ncbi:zygote arrest protein 1-like [Haliotis rufescens]|uniref:zygote arrest protein 1-like n=1 Tax=Haliotis rufescens TaxID=6454 RepID=UPI00201F8D42|nr:zygote arrest protein 1-like [Haliotis rufescens]XP_048249866.1 zygote arrest protein 1-like [Haliotis rufescens]